MRLNTWQAGATFALGATLLAAPVAASASTIYPPSGSCTTSPATVGAGETLSFECAPETFGADERVTITVNGENGSSARIGMVRFGISTASGFAESSADGSLPSVDITLPSNASGNYIIAAISPSSAGGTAAATITAADGALPITGLDSGATLGLVVGGGALVAAGLAIGAAAVIRRRQQNAE